VIENHAAPQKANNDGDRNVLAIVHAAWAFARARQNQEDPRKYMNEDFLRHANVSDRLEKWKAAAETL
jgi:hypothetical protein